MDQVENVIQESQNLQQRIVEHRLFKEILRLSETQIIDEWQQGMYIRALVIDLGRKFKDLDQAEVRAIVFQMLAEYTGEDKQTLYKKESVAARVPLSLRLMIKLPFSAWEEILMLPWYLRLSFVNELYQEKMSGKSFTVREIRQRIKDLKHGLSGDEEIEDLSLKKTFKFYGDVIMENGKIRMYLKGGGFIELDTVLKALVGTRGTKITFTLDGGKEENLDALGYFNAITRE